jgi:hypothetical protein
LSPAMRGGGVPMMSTTTLNEQLPFQQQQQPHNGNKPTTLMVQSSSSSLYSPVDVFPKIFHVRKLYSSLKELAKGQQGRQPRSSSWFMLDAFGASSFRTTHIVEFDTTNNNNNNNSSPQFISTNIVFRVSQSNPLMNIVRCSWVADETLTLMLAGNGKANLHNTLERCVQLVFDIKNKPVRNVFLFRSREERDVFLEVLMLLLFGGEVNNNSELGSAAAAGSLNGNMMKNNDVENIGVFQDDVVGGGDVTIGNSNNNGMLNKIFIADGGKQYMYVGRFDGKDNEVVRVYVGGARVV